MNYPRESHTQGFGISRPSSTLFGRVIDEISCLVLNGNRRGQDRVYHWANRAGIGRVFCDYVAGRLHGTATRVREHDDERRTEHRRAVLNCAEGRSIYEVACVTCDEQFTNAMAAEDQFGRNATDTRAKEKPASVAL